MFRHTLRRCAGRLAASSPIVVPRVSPIFVRSAALTQVRPVGPNRIAGLVSRAYSTEAEAPAVEANEAEVDDKFSSLAELGVHPNLLKAITADMQYDTMTPVQTKTIRPALEGSDMYGTISLAQGIHLLTIL